MRTDIASCSPSSDAGCDRSSRPLVISKTGMGLLWFGGWLFAIGFAQLSFWKAALALAIWPYFLGALAR